jgi:putative flippase GtrA
MTLKAVFDPRRFVRFILVGGATTSCQYIVLTLLVELLHVKADVASSIGYGIGAAVSYVLNRFWTFKSDLSHAQSLPRFIVMIGIGLLLSFAVMHALVDFAGIYYLLAQVLTTGTVMLSNYLLAASWVFIASDTREKHEHT